MFVTIEKRLHLEKNAFLPYKEHRFTENIEFHSQKLEN